MTPVARRRTSIAAALCAIGVLALFPIQMSVFVLAWPPPDTAEAWFALLNERPLLGLLSLDVLLMADWLLLLGVWVGFYVALRERAPRLVLVATAVAIVSTALYFASNTAFQMLQLATDYASATSVGDRSALLAAGESAMARFDGPLFTASYVGSGLATALISYVMRKSPAFGKLAGWIGIAYGVMQLVPPNFGTIGMIVSVSSLLPLLLWLGLVVRGFFRLAREHPTPRSAGEDPGGRRRNARVGNWRRITIVTILPLASVDARAAAPVEVALGPLWALPPPSVRTPRDRLGQNAAGLPAEIPAAALPDDNAASMKFASRRN